MRRLELIERRIRGGEEHATGLGLSVCMSDPHHVAKKLVVEASA